MEPSDSLDDSRESWTAPCKNVEINSPLTLIRYCLLTLQIVAWAAAWSFDEKPFPTPKDFPAEPFERTKACVLSWIAMIGHDCDTYGESAGPLIALTNTWRSWRPWR